jgi:hypothetical protein
VVYYLALGSINTLRALYEVAHLWMSLSITMDDSLSVPSFILATMLAISNGHIALTFLIIAMAVLRAIVQVLPTRMIARLNVELLGVQVLLDEIALSLQYRGALPLTGPPDVLDRLRVLRVHLLS